MKPVIEINDQFQRALRLMEDTSQHIFITGKAGTGKSTLLQYFRARTKKQIAVVAPTGVAALNIQGETIHSFFRFKPGISIKEAKEAGQRRAGDELYAALDSLVIDEISMVRADLLDCLDIFLKAALKSHLPFGGKQLICIGDLYQLPPVVKSSERTALRARYETPYFFSSDVMAVVRQSSDGINFVELEKIYRQRDDEFIAILNAVRNRSIDTALLNALNRRHNHALATNASFICLTSTNEQAHQVNEFNLAKITSPPRFFQGLIEGEFSERDLPTDVNLRLKSGARVMFLNNDSDGRWVNGTLGTIKKMTPGAVAVERDDGGAVKVEPYTWNIYRSVYDRQSRGLRQEKLGSFRQLPLRLAWATTIHKSQGKTFDRAIVDFGRGTFAAGQAYVALSRCRTLDGLVLKQPVKLSHLLLDYRVMKFITSLQYGLAERELSLEKKIEMIKAAIVKGQKLRVTYLKAKDEKSRRELIPLRLGEMEYAGKSFTGLEAYCCLRKEDRTFNVARILKIEPLEVRE